MLRIGRISIYENREKGSRCPEIERLLEAPKDFLWDKLWLRLAPSKGVSAANGTCCGTLTHGPRAGGRAEMGGLWSIGSRWFVTSIWRGTTATTGSARGEPSTHWYPLSPSYIGLSMGDWADEKDMDPILEAASMVIMWATGLGGPTWSLCRSQMAQLCICSRQSV